MTRAEVARKLGVTRTVLADWERDDVVQVERDDRGVPRYSESEVLRVGELIRTGQLAVPPPSRAPKSVSTPCRRPPRAAVTEPILSDDATPEIEIAVAPATDSVDVSATDTVTLQAEDADDAVKRIRLAAVIARADLERIQAEALRDEAVRLLSEAARGRRVECLVGATVETVLPFEREAVDQILRQRLVGSQLEDSFTLRALIAGAISEARVQLAHQRAEADRIAVERRAAAEAQHRATVARAADESRGAAEQAAQAWAVTNAQHRALSIAHTIAVEAAADAPPWISAVAHQAAWNALGQLGPSVDDNTAYFGARAAAMQAAAAAWSMTPVEPPPTSVPFDELRWRRERSRRRRGR